jgi:hypothetical protein
MLLMLKEKKNRKPNLRVLKKPRKRQKRIYLRLRRNLPRSRTLALPNSRSLV